ncbi:polysaccharide deacetylase family protein [Sulfurospirillum arsenophilum]|uniref:polysaccharide deacetylase family protein n=1 Tax=Sulfurospirillum arsenophilum TaxID=56698 RepID=UPI00069336A9|nr:polysaccharide deacetylase family protein [Sulfurospirillum arsenophilum]
MLRLFFSMMLCWLPLSAIEHIEHYEIFTKQYQENDTLFLVSRRFELSGVTFYLTTNTQTLQTKVLSFDASKFMPLDENFSKTPFAKQLSDATALQGKGGATHGTTQNDKAIYLTMDLCPSAKKGYESEFIEHLTKQNGKTPIAIALSSAWREHHTKEFEALLKNPLLEITWVNHTHTHFYDPKLVERQNFMLHVNTDVKAEILGVEKTLLEEGITPSVFFRFPGLIADAKLMRELRETYFLIPLGANAWIAKNEPIKTGSIILIHGNKNEPQGIAMMEKKLPDVVKNYKFHAIKEAFVQ